MCVCARAIFSVYFGSAIRKCVSTFIDYHVVSSLSGELKKKKTVC